MEQHKPFSPLFIGEGSGTSTSSLCACISRLSVPSSSGKALERRGAADRQHAAEAFSPLFIGEGSGTLLDAELDQHIDDFQSPLHRGRLWNRSVSLALSTNYTQTNWELYEKVWVARKPPRFAKNQAP